MSNLAVTRRSAGPFPVLSAAVARGDAQAVISGPAIVRVVDGEQHQTVELDVSVEPPIELHAHAATLIVIPVTVVCVDTDVDMEPFEGSLEVACVGGRTFDVTIEGEVERHLIRPHGVTATAVIESLADVLMERLDAFVHDAEATTGIPL